MTMRLVVLLIVSVLAARAEAQGMFDFVTFDGVHYIRWAEEPGRALTHEDLGIEFATVECSYAEDRAGCAFGRDAAASFMPAGTRMYAVRGYRTDFRLLRAIDVQRGEPTPARPGKPTPLGAKETAALVDMIVRGPMRPPRAYAFGEPRYWLTFWLADGTTLGRPYFPESGELMDGLVLPAEFGRVLERYLRD